VERSSIRRSWKTDLDRQFGQDEEKTMNMVPMVGEWLRSILTGRLYQVRMLTELFAVLKGGDPSNRVYTEIGNLAGKISLFNRLTLSRFGIQDADFKE